MPAAVPVVTAQPVVAIAKALMSAGENEVIPKTMEKWLTSKCHPNWESTSWSVHYFFYISASGVEIYIFLPLCKVVPGILRGLDVWRELCTSSTDHLSGLNPPWNNDHTDHTLKALRPSSPIAGGWEQPESSAECLGGECVLHPQPRNSAWEWAIGWWAITTSDNQLFLLQPGSPAQLNDPYPIISTCDFFRCWSLQKSIEDEKTPIDVWIFKRGLTPPGFIIHLEASSFSIRWRDLFPYPGMVLTCGWTGLDMAGHRKKTHRNRWGGVNASMMALPGSLVSTISIHCVYRCSHFWFKLGAVKRNPAGALSNWCRTFFCVL